MAQKLLVIDDDNSISRPIADRFREKQWHVEIANNLETAKHLLQEEFHPHVIIADLGLPDGDVLEHIEELDETIDPCEWIFVIDEDDSKARPELDDLAYDVLIKPLDHKRLSIIAQRAYRSATAQRTIKNHSQQSHQAYSVNSYQGNSQPVKELKKLLQQLSQVPISAMIITGETGTGKGLVARIVHHSGIRQSGNMVELNCAALPKDLLESQLFGHEAGAFTGAKQRYRGLFEQADGGTLFLDEIGDMDLDLQAKLLKAIEDQTIRRLGSEKEINVDVQIIAATSVDLEEAVRNNQFREDLYHRLSVFCIRLPPLRERLDDMVELVPTIIAEFNANANKKVNEISEQAWQKLLSHDWPGNVRELRNALERCVLLSTDQRLPDEWLQLTSTSLSNQDDRKELPVQPSNNSQGDTLTSNDVESAPIDEPNKQSNTITIHLDGSVALDDMEKMILQRALALNDFNVTQTANALSTTRETLRYRIKKYQLKTER